MAKKMKGAPKATDKSKQPPRTKGGEIKSPEKKRAQKGSAAAGETLSAAWWKANVAT
jgi:hypothetical protein